MKNEKCKMINDKSRRAGFSLVELLVVITIIAILSVVAYVALGGQTTKARNSRRMQDVSTIQSALEIYFINHNNTYPSTLGDLITDNLMNEIPVDPTTDGDYYYTKAVNSKTYQLASSMEDETGGAIHSAYVVGNGSGLLNAGDSVTAEICSNSNDCQVDDEGTNCLPYCL